MKTNEFEHKHLGFIFQNYNIFENCFKVSSVLPWKVAEQHSRQWCAMLCLCKQFQTNISCVKKLPFQNHFHCNQTEAPRSNFRAKVLHFIKSISTFHHLVLLQFDNFDFDCCDCSWSSEEFIKAAAVVSLFVSYFLLKNRKIHCYLWDQQQNQLYFLLLGRVGAIPSLLSEVQDAVIVAVVSLPMSNDTVLLES